MITRGSTRSRLCAMTIKATVKELPAKGAHFGGPIEECGSGRIIMMIVPGANDMQLYQTTHKLAYNL